MTVCHQRKKCLPHLLWIGGLLIILDALGRYCADSLPYPDPTPELLKVQRDQIDTAKDLAILGTLFFAGGILWINWRKALKVRAKTAGPPAASTDHPDT